MPDIHEDSLLIVGDRRRRGRPRVENPKAVLSTRIAPGIYDHLVKMANRREQSVSSLVSDLLAMSVRRIS